MVLLYFSTIVVWDIIELSATCSCYCSAGHWKHISSQEAPLISFACIQIKPFI